MESPTIRVNSPVSQIPEVDNITEDSVEWVILDETDEEIVDNDSDDTRQGQSNTNPLDDMENSSSNDPESRSAVDSKMATEEAHVDSPTDQTPVKVSQDGPASGSLTSHTKIRPNVKLDLPALIEFSPPITGDSIPVTPDTSDRNGHELQVTNESISLNVLTLLVTLAALINRGLQNIYQGMWALFRQKFVIPPPIPPTSPKGKVEENKRKRSWKDSNSVNPEAPKPRPRKSVTRSTPKETAPIRLDDNVTDQKIPPNSIITSIKYNYGVLEIGAGSIIEWISDNQGIISIGENSRVIGIYNNVGTICTGGNSIVARCLNNRGTLMTGPNDRVHLTWNNGRIYTGPGTRLTFDYCFSKNAWEVDGDYYVHKRPYTRKAFKIQMVNGKWKVAPLKWDHIPDNFDSLSSAFGIPPDARCRSSTRNAHIHHNSRR